MSCQVGRIKNTVGFIGIVVAAVCDFNTKNQKKCKIRGKVKKTRPKMGALNILFGLSLPMLIMVRRINGFFSRFALHIIIFVNFTIEISSLSFSIHQNDTDSVNRYACN